MIFFNKTCNNYFISYLWFEIKSNLLIKKGHLSKILRNVENRFGRFLAPLKTSKTLHF